MKDIHNCLDKRGIEIVQSGITNLKLPIRLKSNTGEQLIVADVEMSVNLNPERKGVHMSRLIELSKMINGLYLNKNSLEKLVKRIKERLGSENAKIEFSFTYFLNKKTPITKLECQTDYFCNLICEIKDKVIQHGLKIDIPVTTLCPCSKAISLSGAAHNQRAKVTLLVSSKKFIEIEKLIRLIEKSVCGEIYSLLKRSDEKFITDRMYNNPMFVEDIVREVASILEGDKKKEKISDYKIICKSYESIHNHNVFAIVENKKIHLQALSK